MPVEHHVDAELKVDDGLGDLITLQDPNPVLQAILALLAARPDTVTLQRIAHVALSGHRLVVADDDGEVVYGDSANAGDIARPVWLTVSAWDAGATATLTAYGVVTEGSWSWIPGTALFLGHGGQITQTVPDSPDAFFSRQVGTAITETQIFYNPSLPIEL